MPKLKTNEILCIYSMGKKFPVRGIYTTEREANEHCEKDSNIAVIADVGGFIFVADKYESF